MLPYWLLFSVFATGAVANFRDPGAGRRRRPALIVCCVAIALMIGTRFRVGADWDNYVSMYVFVENLDFVDALRVTDPGYAGLNWVTGRAGYDIWAVNMVCGLIVAWGLLKFARRQPNPWLAILIAAPYLIIVVAMGYSRQAVAVGFVLVALSVVDKASFAKFVFYIFCAAAFHKSAIFVLPLAALAMTKNRFLIAASLALMLVIMFYLFVSADYDRLVSSYVDTEYDSSGAAIRVAMNILPAGLFLLYQRRFVDNEIQRLLWRNFSYAAFLMLALLLVLTSSTIVDRLALYLIPLQIFVLSRLPQAIPKSRQPDLRLVVAVILYSASIQFVWLNFATFADWWIPYQSFLTDEADY